MSDSESTFPAQLVRLWGVADSSGLGRPAALTLPRILEVATTLADADGLAGVSLPKIAKRLDVTPMSLYRHVGSKDELLQLLQDRGVGDPPPAITSGLRRGLSEWACALRRVYDRHPWLVDIPISGPPAGPKQLAWLEAALRVLRDTGLNWHEKVGIATLLSGYVRQSTQLTQELSHGRGDVDQATAEREYGAALARLVDPATYPELAELFGSDTFTDPPDMSAADPAAHPDFAFGLEAILDAVDVAVTRANPKSR